MTIDRKLMTKKMNEAFKIALTSSNLKQLGDETARQMKGRVRQGKSVTAHEARESKFKPLAASTVASKKRRRNMLGRFARPTRSNLNDTGIMVDSIQAKRKRTGFIIDVSNERANIAEYHHKGAPNLPKRPFLFLSDKEVKRLTRSYNNLLDGALVKVNALS